MHLTVKQAARVLEITPRRVRQLITEERLAATLVDGRWQVESVEVLSPARPVGNPLMRKGYYAELQRAKLAL